jgi:hypothetical protein
MKDRVGLAAYSPASVQITSATFSDDDGMGQIVASVEARIALIAEETPQSAPMARIYNNDGNLVAEAEMFEVGGLPNDATHQATGIGAGMFTNGEAYCFRVELTYELNIRITDLKASDARAAVAAREG